MDYFGLSWITMDYLEYIGLSGIYGIFRIITDYSGLFGIISGSEHGLWELSTPESVSLEFSPRALYLCDLSVNPQPSKNIVIVYVGVLLRLTSPHTPRAPFKGTSKRIDILKICFHG